ncbi:hypothetical protein LEN26_003990 [Aphanomyces euteiches]|nr:hypothetical protein LEN26_003990 [Aphanomyces euteiches]
MEITSSWSPNVDLGLAEEIQGKEIHIFTSQATKLLRADEEKTCSITIVLSSVVKLLDLDIESSARHVEVYIVSISPTGERLFSYVDTIRGLKAADLYHVAYALSNDTALQVASGVSFKFLSIQPPQEKDCLKLAKLKLRIQASTVVQPVAPVPEPANPTPARAPIDMDSMKMILAMQQAMQKQMEEKIYQVVDSRLNLLTQRLQSTESMLHKLTTKFSKAEMKQDKDAFASLLKRLATLEKQVGSMKAANGNLTASLEQLAIDASDSLSSDVADGRQNRKMTTTTDITAVLESSFARTSASTNPSQSMDQRVASLDSAALTASISERDTAVSQDLDRAT